MSYDFLLDAVSEDAPCGPDLDEAQDDPYMSYFIVSEGQFPERFFNQNSGEPFSKTSINLEAARGAISELLERSRDIRLLVLSAKINILGGDIKEFCADVISITKLLEDRWDNVHPTFDVEPNDRSMQVSQLEDRTTILLPLQFAELIRTKKVGVISYRDYAVATGNVAAQGSGKEISASEILSALKSDDVAEEVEKIHDLLLETYKAANSIREIFIEKIGYENLPNVDALTDVLSKIIEMFGLAREDLAASQSVIVNEASSKDENSDAENHSVIQITEIPESPEGITSHATARSALKASEIYYATYEPSSPALVLIHQARNLIGVSLIEAIDALMPEVSERASILVNRRPNLQLKSDRLRTISNNAKQSANGSGSDETKQFLAADRAQAMALINGVENYYRTAEPSSPVPHLLMKTREYLDRNFETIINDILKNEQTTDETNN